MTITNTFKTLKQTSTETFLSGKDYYLDLGTGLAAESESDTAMSIPGQITRRFADATDGGSETLDTGAKTLTNVMFVPSTSANELFNVGNSTITTSADGSIGGANNFIAQRFRVNQDCNVSKLQVQVRKVGTPVDDLDIEIQTDSSSEPSGTPVTNGTTSIAEGDITTGYVLEDATFTTDPALTAGTDYWIVLKSPSGSNGDYFIEYDNGNSLYTTGAVAVTTDGGTTWSPNDNTDTSGFNIFINKFSEMSEFDAASSGNMLLRNQFTGLTKDTTLEYRITVVKSYDININV